MVELRQRELEDIRYAKSLLENPGLAAKITTLLGAPIEKGFELLPENWSKRVLASSEKALQAAVHSAVLTLDTRTEKQSANRFHKLLAASSGAAGGFFGLPALAVELPVSTTIMMRSIADIARSEGLDLADVAVKLACVEVFALGGPSREDDGAETGYFAVRAVLAGAVNDAAKHLASKGLTEKGAPVLLRLLSQVAARFGVQVSEKVAAQALPVIGAAGGAIVNSVFIDHFQAMARGHFIIYRLEQKYGIALVRQAYETLI